MPVNLASPGVVIREVDLTLGNVSTSNESIGAIVSPFSRGPVDEPVLIASENQLLETFGEPSSTDRQYEGWLTISSYLAYGGVVQVVRSDNDELSNAFVGTASSIKINSLADYESRGYDENVIPGVTVAARNPGSWANGVLVAFIDGQADQILSVPGIATSPVIPVLGDGIVQYISKETAGAGTTSTAEGFLKSIITGINTVTEEIQVKVLSFKASDNPNETILSDDGFVEVDYQQGGTWSFVADGVTVYDAAGITTAISAVTPRDWFDDQTVRIGRNTTVSWNQLANRPTTTGFGENRGARFDEFHICVFDATGEVTGNAGTILEKNIGLSKATDAEFSVGSPSYWRKYLANNSDYIFGGSQPVGVVTCSFEPGVGNGFTPETGGEWDRQARNINFFGCGNVPLVIDGGKNYDGGEDPAAAGALAVSPADIAAGYDNFESDDELDIDFLLMGSASYDINGARSIANKLISIAEQRRDTLAFISPYRGSQITDSGTGASVSLSSDEITSRVIDFYSTVASSSYAILDSGYKFMFDRFADKFRYVPLNGDIAGCCARTDQIAFPWFSPAGTTRGAVLNGTRLAYNPTQLQRDRLYSARINPVVFATDVGGIVLFGDKTALSAASAFDRINVRRLFIYMEDAIGAAAKDQLFEFNDEVTRTNFVNIVEPFLRDIESKRGITEFVVVCDETNNTPAVIDRNEFVADIFVKPARSINFIGLTFVATRSGVSFEEIIGNV
jgi:hypothetical protein